MADQVSEVESAQPPGASKPARARADSSLEPSPFADLLEEAREPAESYALDDLSPIPEAESDDLAATQAMPAVSRILPQAATEARVVGSDASGASSDENETLPPTAAERAATRILSPVVETPQSEENTADSPPPNHGRWIGSYQVQGVLGEGGMAVVHRGYQPSLQRPVAIKSLREEYLHDPELVSRFEREAASLAQLQHGNVVQVLDVVTTDDEGRHIVMELVDGVDGFDLLASAGRLSPDVVSLIALEVARGLEHAHLRGIVHRDIKPSNVFISKRGEVKLMDFGIARDPSSSELTQIGLSVGTPAYMAPEQIRGEAVDGRTDLFAVGIVLFELLTGNPPWPEGQGRNVALEVLRSPPPSLSDACPEAPLELVRIVEQCLDKDPERRWTSAHALRRALEQLVHERVPIDPRGRLVLDLEARGFVTAEEAARLVPPGLRAPGPRPGRKKGRSPAAARILRPIALAHAVGIVVIVAAAVVSLSAPVGTPLPSPRPVLLPASAAPKPPEAPPAEPTSLAPKSLAPTPTAALPAAPRKAKALSPRAKKKRSARAKARARRRAARRTNR